MKSRRGALLSLSSAFVLASVAGISAHFVRGLESPDVAAFVSSPTGATDVPIKLAWTAGTTPIDTGLSVACFYVANSYHQDYAARHPDDPYIVVNDVPKVAHLQQRLPELYRPQPQVVEVDLH